MINQWYYVAFVGNNSGIYCTFEKKGFNHCFIFHPIDGERLEDSTEFYVIEHNKMFIKMGISSKDNILKYVGDGIIIRARSKRIVRPKWWWWIPTPDSCVTIVKQIMGVRKPLVWSPYQLYKHIIKEHKWDQ